MSKLLYNILKISGVANAPPPLVARLSNITVFKSHQTVVANLTVLFVQIPPYQLKFNLAEQRWKQLLETFLDRLLLQMLQTNYPQMLHAQLHEFGDDKLSR